MTQAIGLPIPGQPSSLWKLPTATAMALDSSSVIEWVLWS